MHILNAELTKVEDGFVTEASSISWRGERVLIADGKRFTFANREEEAGNEDVAAWIFRANDGTKLTVFND
jgi:hypothetical protein